MTVRLLIFMRYQREHCPKKVMKPLQTGCARSPQGLGSVWFLDIPSAAKAAMQW